MTSNLVLVVEDDRQINEALADRLRAEGFEVAQAFDGLSAVSLAGEVAPDVVLLDLMLPGVDGHEVCRRIQAERPVPVLMLTARDEESDILVGLAVGADDYLTKPFRMKEVVARVRALLRRVERARALAAAGPEVHTVAGLCIDSGARRASLDGDDVHLTPTEFDLLLCLARVAGQVVSRERLLSEVWGWDSSLGSRTLDSHVRALRAKIGHDRIRTVHGVGYALEGAR